MKNLYPGVENGRTNGVSGLGLRPDPTINIKVSNEHNEYLLAVPSKSTFADLKSVIAEVTGLKVENYKLLFRGKEKEDDEYLEAAGVKDSSKLLLVEHEQKSSHENVAEIPVISKGGEAVAEIRKEVDKLSEQVSALQTTLDSGKKADEKNIIFLTEMLMRQLLKLDGIEAEGEGKIQRKMEVRRVQSLVDTMDVLKSRNSKPSNNVVENSVPVTTQWENFEPANESANTPSPTHIPAHTPPSSSSPVPSSAPEVPSPVHVHAPSAANSPSHMPSAATAPVPSSSSSHGTSSATPHYPPDHTPMYGPSSHIPPYHYDAPPYAAFPHETPQSHAPYPYGASYTPYHPSSYGPPSHAPHHYDASSYASFPHETPPPHSHFPHGAPYAHTHYAPNPYVSAPYPPNPYETAPYAPNPYATSYNTPPPMQPHDPSGTRSYDPSPGPSYDPTVPSSTKVTRDWERFE